MESKIISFYRLNRGNRICQGDTYQDLKIHSSYSTDEEIINDEITFPYFIVLSQDCDLEQDFDKRILLEQSNLDDKKEKECYNKFLDSILICPAFLADVLREGKHLENIGRKLERINSKEWGKVKSNDNHRYYYLNSESINNGNSFEIPELTLDFKKYYTVPRDYLYLHKDKCIASLNELIREDLSNRFAYFQSRIGLPMISDNSSFCPKNSSCSTNSNS